MTASRLFGGTGDDETTDVAVDGDGNVIVVGKTDSVDLPVHDAAQPAPGGRCDEAECHDAFVAKFSQRGQVIFATYLGGSQGSEGSGQDYGNSVAVDDEGSVYVAGATSSHDFPTTLGSVKPRLGRNETNDAFVTKLDSDGRIMYSTFLGGAAHKQEPQVDGLATAADIAVDTSGNAYVVGTTSNPDFPTRLAPQPLLAGEEDAFVAKIDPTGSQLLFSTFVGGEDYDSGSAIEAARDGSFWATGSTLSPDFPTSSGALQKEKAGSRDAFLTVMDGSPQFQYATFLGGSSADFGSDLQVRRTGEVIVMSAVTSDDFPGTEPGKGGLDVVVSEFRPEGTSIRSVRIGGSGHDYPSSLNIVDSGGLIIGGLTYSRDLALLNPLQGNHPLDDGFITRTSDSGRVSFATYIGASAREGVVIATAGDITYATGTTSAGDFATMNFRPQPRGEDVFVMRMREQAARCTMRGTGSADSIRGSGSGDHLCGRKGPDRLYGRRGRDVLVGGPAGDVLRGGRGFDTCIGGAGRDRLIGCEMSVPKR